MQAGLQVADSAEERAFWRRPLKDAVEGFVGTRESDEELDAAVLEVLQEEGIEEGELAGLLGTTLDRVAPNLDWTSEQGLYVPVCARKSEGSAGSSNEG